MKQMETNDLRDFVCKWQLRVATDERKEVAYITRDSMEQYNLRRARVTVSGRREPTYLADELVHVRKGTRCRQTHR